MLLALVSAKGSPGVTTTALALAASASHALGRDRVLMLEADAAGGDVECWCGPLGEPGLLGAVADVRGQSGGTRLPGHAVEAVPGVEAITAPTTDVVAAAALRSASADFSEEVANCDRTVVVDLGRVPSTAVRHEGLLTGADVVGVVCRPSLSSIEHTRALVAALSTVVPVSAVVVGGTRPYAPNEIAAALGTDVAGVLPWDPRGVTALIDRGIGRSWLRSALGVAACRLFEGLARERSDAGARAHG